MDLKLSKTMKTRATPKHIIACKISGVDNYVFNAPFGPDNKRMAILTSDPEKARRFFDEQEARNYISKV